MENLTDAKKFILVSAIMLDGVPQEYSGEIWRTREKNNKGEYNFYAVILITAYGEKRHLGIVYVMNAPERKERIKMRADTARMIRAARQFVLFYRRTSQKRRSSDV